MTKKTDQWWWNLHHVVNSCLEMRRAKKRREEKRWTSLSWCNCFPQGSVCPSLLYEEPADSGVAPPQPALGENMEEHRAVDVDGRRQTGRTTRLRICGRAAPRPIPSKPAGSESAPRTQLVPWGGLQAGNLSWRRRDPVWSRVSIEGLESFL